MLRSILYFNQGLLQREILKHYVPGVTTFTLLLLLILKYLHLTFVQGNLIHFYLYKKQESMSWKTSTSITGISFASYHQVIQTVGHQYHEQL